MVFFDESVAQQRGEQEILLVRIPRVKGKRNGNHGFDIEFFLPEPQVQSYTDRREGRIVLEHGQNLLEKLLSMGEEETKIFGHGIRGMAGGIVYVSEGSFILQEKSYPRSGDKYLSCFSGLSSSLQDIKNPRRIIAREGVEELFIQQPSCEKGYVPGIDTSSFFAGRCTEDDIFSWTKEAVHKMRAKDGGRQLRCMTWSSCRIAVRGERDTFTLKDAYGNLLDTFPCILDPNPHANGIEILKIVELYDLPKDTHFSEAEFGNRVVVVPFLQLRDMWRNWGKPLLLKSYLPSGEVKECEYLGWCDSLVQNVGMSLGLIQGQVRFDYKQYGEKST